jgi:hypothetical protein
MGANAISRLMTQRDVARMSAQVKGSPFDSVRPWQTPGTALEFPDTEEISGTNPVLPRFFEIMSSGGSLKGSQPPAVLRPRGTDHSVHRRGLCLRTSWPSWSACNTQRRMSSSMAPGTAKPGVAPAAAVRPQVSSSSPGSSQEEARKRAGHD